jgi:hypothetical protein
LAKYLKALAIFFQKAKEEVDKNLFGLKDVKLDERLVNLSLCFKTKIPRGLNEVFKLSKRWCPVAES